MADVRRYLREFLMDGRVLDVNWLLRFCIVHFAILPSRPKQSAEAYHKIWTPAGSPLVVTSRNVQAKLQQRVTVPVELAMRYQNPSIPEAVRSLAQKGVDEVLLIPLFPHYAMSSFETAVERVKEVAAELAPQMRVQVQPPCFDQPDYIAALAASAQDLLQRGYDHLLFSFHGLPERHMRKSDPTGRHCLATEQLLRDAQPGACHLLPRAMLQDRRRLRAASRRAERANTRSRSSPGWGAIPGSSPTPTTSFRGWRSAASRSCW